MGKKRILVAILASFGMLALILDGKTAVSSMQDGIKICLQTVVPALFPFFLLSPILTGTLWGTNSKLFKRIGKLCKLSAGSESLLLIGFLSGYPVGAQLVTQAYQDRKLSAHSARRMLGFCSNAGPAFIFGMLSSLFSRAIIPWVLWLVQMASSISVGILLPDHGKENEGMIKPNGFVAFSEILKNAIKTMATVCGWVLIFRVIIGFCERWFLWILPLEIRVLFSGIMELANGCVALTLLSNEYLRFIFSSVFLSFGGMCVAMQTASVTKGLGFGMYFPGKLLQAMFSFMISCLLCPVLFPQDKFYLLPFAVPSLLLGIGILIIRQTQRKKSCSI